MADTLEGYSPDEIASMAATYQALLGNPETREVTLRSTKKINPSLSIPEVDLKDATRGAFQSVNERMEKMQQDQLRRDMEARVERERSNLRESGFDKDQIAAIEKIMVTEQIPNYQTAAKYFRNEQRLAEPSPNLGQAQPGVTFDLPKEQMEAMKGGKAGLTKFARTQAEQAMAELRGGRIKLQ